MARQKQDEIKCTLESRPGGMLIHVIGEVGSPPTTEFLQHEFDRACAGHPKMLVINLAELKFVSSLGIGILIAARHAINRTGGKVRVVAVQPAVMGVLKRCRANELFEFFDSVDPAFAD